MLGATKSDLKSLYAFSVDMDDSVPAETSPIGPLPTGAEANDALALQTISSPR